MLALVGMGLAPGDISERALEFLRGASKLYFEGYTASFGKDAIEHIEKSAGKPVEMLQRADMEDGLKATVSGARDGTVAILVYGDPLVATTHHIILDEAHKQDIATKVFHSSSILSAAIGESRLDVYRFGPPVTIPYWSEKYRPTSFLNSIERNVSGNQHTMLLLDINQKERKPMKLPEALAIIADAQSSSGKKTFEDGTRMLIMGNVGRDDQEIALTTFSTAVALAGAFEGKMLTIILPSKPNFAEEEALSLFQKP